MIPVRIMGSVAFDNCGAGFEPIDSETPYELIVRGFNIVLIVKAMDPDQNIDFSLSKNGRLETHGADNSMYSVGDNITKPGALFSANY